MTAAKIRSLKLKKKEPTNTLQRHKNLILNCHELDDEEAVFNLYHFFQVFSQKKVQLLNTISEISFGTDAATSILENNLLSCGK